MEPKSRRQVSREAGFTKSVEVEQFFVTQTAIVLKGQGTTRTCREYSAMRDGPDAEVKGVLGDNTNHFRTHPRCKSLVAIWKIRHRGADRFRKWRGIKILGGYQ